MGKRAKPPKEQGGPSFTATGEKGGAETSGKSKPDESGAAFAAAEVEARYFEPSLKPFDLGNWNFQMPELAVAERRAAMADEAADYYQVAGDTERAENEREIAACWRQLRALPETDDPQRISNVELVLPDKEINYGDWVEGAQCCIDILLARAEQSQAPVEHLRGILFQLLNGLLRARSPWQQGSRQNVGRTALQQLERI